MKLVKKSFIPILQKKKIKGIAHASRTNSTYTGSTATTSTSNSTSTSTSTLLSISPTIPISVEIDNAQNYSAFQQLEQQEQELVQKIIIFNAIKNQNLKNQEQQLENFQFQVKQLEKEKMESEQKLREQLSRQEFTLLKVTEQNQKLKEELEILQRSMECLICMSRIATVVLLPCKHQILCNSCFKTACSSSRLCPKCRISFTDHFEVRTEYPEFCFATLRTSSTLPLEQLT